MDTYKPVYKSDLTFEDRKKALASLMFITEKTNGDIKARKVADGSKQRTYDGYKNLTVPHRLFSRIASFLQV